MGKDNIQPLGNIIDEVVGQLNIGHRLKVSGIFNHWKDIVGSQISKKSKPQRLKNGTLYVSVTSSTWANELDLMSQQLIEKINQYAGCEVVEQIRFKADLKNDDF
ncbi:MAG: DUF721 domain-containing protein [Actinomycetia bacterium]|nr:DUF721 domain-containing protein [Actinomycetes bacterium]